MARRAVGLRNRKNKPKVDVKVRVEQLDYHEGLSANQVKVVLHEFGLGGRVGQFNDWMYGQTCPIIARYKEDGTGIEQAVGVYEYDLFRWIANQTQGKPLLWD